jgi:hypothetical protein
MMTNCIKKRYFAAGLLLALIMSAAPAASSQTADVTHEQARCEDYASHPAPNYRIARLDRADMGPMLTLYISISPADFEREQLISLSCKLGHDYSNEEILGVWIFDSFEAAKWYAPIGYTRGLGKKTGPVLAEYGFSRQGPNKDHSLDWWPTPSDRNHRINIDLGPLPIQQTASPKTENIPAQETLEPKESNGKWGFVDSAGVFVIKPKYFAAQPFHDGLAMVVARKAATPFGQEFGEFRLAQITYIDHSGRQIHPPISVREARSFSEGLAVVVPDSPLRLKSGCAKGGYLDTKGEWAIEPQFDGLTDFSEGLAAVNVGANCGLGGKWGYVDRYRRVMIQFKFQWAGPFHDGKACVKEKDGQSSVIDLNGQVIPNEKCQE